jgi:hypothetical protein
MRWIVGRQIGTPDTGVDWLRRLLGGPDTSRVDWLRIDFGRGVKRGAYGRCWYPARDRAKGYRISVQVPGPFPWTIERYTKPLYRNCDGTWPKVPADCRPAGYCCDERTGREWQRLITGYGLQTIQEGIVFVGSHEVFHFLRHSRQIAGRNGENEADQFAFGQLNDFRRLSDRPPE